MNCKNISEKFEKLKSENDKENEFLFKQIYNSFTSSDKNIYDDDDIIGMTVINILKKCNWLNVDNRNDFDNVSNLINDIMLYLNDNKSIMNDKRMYNTFVSCILGHTEWGGKREGSGRKLTGRKRRFLYLTDDESEKVDKFIKELRTASTKNISMLTKEVDSVC